MIDKSLWASLGRQFGLLVNVGTVFLYGRAHQLLMTS